MANLRIEDEYGIVTENARRREVFADFVERRVAIYMESPAGRSRIAREIDARLKAEIDALVERKTKERLAELERLSGRQGPEVATILALVCAVTGVRLDDLLGPRRQRSLAWPRHFATYMLKQVRSDLSYPAIARVLKRADHTTCLAALQRFELIRDTVPVCDWLADERVQAMLAEFGNADAHRLQEAA